MQSGNLMKENELSTPSRLLIGTALAAVAVLGYAAAVTNILRGVVPRPSCFLISLLGLFLFLIPKISVVRHKKLVSFGTALMTENQANSYRIGYVLMALGIIFAFVS